MKVKEFEIHKNRWLSMSVNSNTPDINFETYMRMNGMGKEEFSKFNDQDGETVN